MPLSTEEMEQHFNNMLSIANQMLDNKHIDRHHSHAITAPLETHSEDETTAVNHILIDILTNEQTPPDINYRNIQSGLHNDNPTLQLITRLAIITAFLSPHYTKTLILFDETPEQHELKTLNIKREGLIALAQMHPHLFKQICTAIQQLNIETADFSWNSQTYLSKEQRALLFNAISQSKLKRLDIGLNRIAQLEHDEIFQLIIESIQHSSIETLDISENHFTQNELNIFTQSITNRNVSIKHIELNDRKLKLPQSVTAILTRNQQLTKIKAITDAALSTTDGATITVQRQALLHINNALDSIIDIHTRQALAYKEIFSAYLEPLYSNLMQHTYLSCRDNDFSPHEALIKALQEIIITDSNNQLVFFEFEQPDNQRFLDMILLNCNNITGIPSPAQINPLQRSALIQLAFLNSLKEKSYDGTRTRKYVYPSRVTLFNQQIVEQATINYDLLPKLTSTDDLSQLTEEACGKIHLEYLKFIAITEQPNAIHPTTFSRLTNDESAIVKRMRTHA